jgi:hypothetical protein
VKGGGAALAALSGNDVPRTTFLSKWECALRIRDGGISKIVKDARARPEDPVRNRLPGYAEPRSEVVFLCLP